MMSDTVSIGKYDQLQHDVPISTRKRTKPKWNIDENLWVVGVLASQTISLSYNSGRLEKLIDLKRTTHTHTNILHAHPHT